jgi:hypothetical protein
MTSENLETTHDEEKISEVENKLMGRIFELSSSKNIFDRVDLWYTKRLSRLLGIPNSLIQKKEKQGKVQSHHS